MVAVLVAPRTLALRCAACHDDLGRDAHVCAYCRTALHLDCRLELRRCPTLGCPGRGPAAHVRLVQPGQARHSTATGGRNRGLTRPALLRRPFLTGAGVALASASLVGGFMHAGQFESVVWMIVAHLLVLPAVLAIVARRGREGEGAARAVLLPLGMTVVLQVFGSPLALGAGAIATCDLPAFFKLAGFVAFVLQPVVAGLLVARATRVREPARFVV